MGRSPQSDFGNYLDVLLRERGLSVAAFGRLVGLRTSSVSTAKRETLNPKRLEPWANALRLHGEQRERFFELAWLAHTPPYIRELLQRERDRIEALSMPARRRSKPTRR
jgi:hypothetical protein